MRTASRVVGLPEPIRALSHGFPRGLARIGDSGRGGRAMRIRAIKALAMDVKGWLKLPEKVRKIVGSVPAGLVAVKKPPTVMFALGNRIVGWLVQAQRRRLALHLVDNPRRKSSASRAISSRGVFESSPSTRAWAMRAASSSCERSLASISSRTQGVARTCASAWPWVDSWPLRGGGPS